MPWPFTKKDSSPGANITQDLKTLGLYTLSDDKTERRMGSIREQFELLRYVDDPYTKIGLVEMMVKLAATAYLEGKSNQVAAFLQENWELLVADALWLAHVVDPLPPPPPPPEKPKKGRKRKTSKSETVGDEPTKPVSKEEETEHEESKEEEPEEEPPEGEDKVPPDADEPEGPDLPGKPEPSKDVTAVEKILEDVKAAIKQTRDLELKAKTEAEVNDLALRKQCSQALENFFVPYAKMIVDVSFSDKHTAPAFAAVIQNMNPPDLRFGGEEEPVK